MLTGKVVRFDDTRGYGFIAPDGGGEDVFVHANALGDEKWVFAPGVPVEFEAVDSDRGPKALSARVIRGATRVVSPPLASPVTSPVASLPPSTVAVLAATPAAAPPIVRVTPIPAAAPAASAALAAPAASAALAAPAAPAGQPRPNDGFDDEDGLCDVLSERVFVQEVTETLLDSMPGLTAAQVIDLRRQLLVLARRHGWVED